MYYYAYFICSSGIEYYWYYYDVFILYMYKVPSVKQHLRHQQCAHKKPPKMVTPQNGHSAVIIQ